MKNFLLALLLFSFAGSISLMAQDTNRIDDQGRKQGKWMDRYPNGQLRYEGQFKNDKCQGEFKYYDEQGKLRATNLFDKSGTRALNKTYASNGTLVATGYYLNQKKEGEWSFFAEENGVRILQENYVEGVAQGLSKVFYETGVLMTERYYVDGVLEGPSKTYYPSGALKEEGTYHNDAKSGLWKTYNEDGDVVSEERYGATPGSL